jgi:hypothetical protein
VLSRSSLCLDMPTIYGPSADIDPGQAYLFQCDDNGLFAVSLDPTGGNLPRDPCAEGVRRSWRRPARLFLFSLSTTTKLATRRCFWHKPGGAVSWNARW